VVTCVAGLAAGCSGPLSVTSIEPDHGPSSGGTQVTLTGTGLRDTVTVYIGTGQLQKLTRTSDTSVTGRTGSHRHGIQDVEVITEDGTLTLTGAFTYVAPPPEVTTIVPALGPVAGGTRLVLTGSNFSDVQSVTLGGRSATVLWAQSETYLTVLSPPGVAGDQDVVVTTSYGSGVLPGGFHYAESPQQFGTDAEDLANGIAIAPDGSAVVVGATEGAFPTFTNRGSHDVAIVRRRPDGSQTAVQIGTDYVDLAEAVAIDPSGVVYTVGSMWTETSKDLFIATTRTTTSTDHFGTSADDHAYGVTTDQSDSFPSAYVVGETKGAFPGFTSAGGADLFLVRVSPLSGRSVLMQYGTGGDDRATGVAFDASSGNLYLAGTTTGAFPGYRSAGGSDVFVIKMTLGGAVLWVAQFGTAADDVAAGVAVAPTGEPYLAGSTLGAFPGATSAGDSDLFVAKLDPSGAWQWLRQVGTAQLDRAGGIAVDSNGSAYVNGWTMGWFPGTNNMGREDVVLTKLEANGQLQWTRQIGSSGYDQGRGVALDGAGVIHVTGWSRGAFPGCTSLGLSDMFLAKFNSSGLRL